MSAPLQSLRAKAQLYVWGGREALRLGRPEVSLGFLGGIGDDLLCTAPIAEWLRRGVQNLWFFTRHPDLHAHVDSRVRLVPEDARYRRLAARLGAPMRALSTTIETAADRDTPLTEHLIAAMCRRAGLTGKVTLRPHLSLLPDELARAAPFKDYIAIQSSTLAAAVPMRNKQWRVDRLQAVVDRLAGSLEFVQIGSPADPPLRGVSDLRGKTSLREAAAVLAQARLFLGLVGFTMHLARAIECPAVIVYGGREPAEFTGYPCNANIALRPPCAPCWQRNGCDFAHACMEGISSTEVTAAVESMLTRPRAPLVVDTISL